METDIITNRVYEDRNNRGFFAIGIENIKTQGNLGVLWRSAILLNASFIFTIGTKYKEDRSDTCSTQRHTPMFHYDDWDDFRKHVPAKSDIVGVELDDRAYPLERFCHPARGIYLLGNERTGLSPRAIKESRYLIKMNTSWSLNVAAAGSMIMWDRYLKEYQRGLI